MPFLLCGQLPVFINYPNGLIVVLIKSTTAKPYQEKTTEVQDRIEIGMNETILTVK